MIFLQILYNISYIVIVYITNMGKKKDIHNSFFDLIAFGLSFILSFFRSIKVFFTNSIWLKKRKSIFFDFLDFIFRKWSSYFWKKPSFYKITSFFWDILNSIFKK